MSYESYTLGTIYTSLGEANESPTDPREPNGSQWGANSSQLGDLNPFWVGTRLFCFETLVGYLQKVFY